MAKREKTPPLRLEVVQFLNKWDKRLTFRTMKPAPAPPKRPKNLLFFKKWERSLIFGGGEGEGGSGSDGAVVVYPLRGSFTLTARGVVEIESRRASVQIGRGFSLLYSEEHLQRRAARVAWNDKAPHDRAPEIRSGATAEALEGYALTWSDAERFRIGQAVVWSAQEKAEQVRGIGWTGVENYKEARGISWSDRKPVAKTAAAQWRKISEQRRRAGLSWSGTEQNGASAAIGSKDGRAAGIYSATVWGAMGDLIDTPGKSYRPQPRPPHEIKDAPPLIFCHEWRPLLRFGHCGKGKINENREVYIVNNSAFIYREADGVEIQATGLEISSDLQSVGWALSLQSPLTEREKLEGAAVVVELNHLKWLFFIDEIEERHQFNSRSISARGLSGALVLDKLRLPAYISEGYDTAAGIAYNSANLPINSGIEIEWRVPDWEVPAGLPFKEESALDRIKYIADAPGAALIAHYSEPSLAIASPYSVDRWRETPEDAVSYTIGRGRLLSLSEKREERLNANAVHVIGEDGAGIIAAIKIRGGDIHGGQFNHPLITDQAPAVERGRVEINKGGNKNIINTESPIYSDLPELYPADVVKIGERVGVVQSVKFRANWGGALTLRLSLTLEEAEEGEA